MDAIGKLTGGVAHDFNNLPAAVLGSLELARKRMSEGKDIGRFIDNAMQAAQRGVTLTQRMLAFARKQELLLSRVNVTEVVGGMVDLLQQTIGPGIAVETRFPLVLSDVRTDAGQLELAILNLAVNARDAMSDGGRIVIAAEEVVTQEGDHSGLPAGTYVRLAASDTGEGMDDDTLAHAISKRWWTCRGSASPSRKRSCAGSSSTRHVPAGSRRDSMSPDRLPSESQASIHPMPPSTPSPPWSGPEDRGACAEASAVAS